MSRLLIVVLSSLSATFTGCAVYGLQNDQGKIRHALLDLYTNQIMDNLVRQYNGLPIIQLDYGNATAQLTIKDSTGLTDSLATSNPGILRVIAGSTATVLKSTLNTVTGNASADRANQVSVTATPVTTSADVYVAYQDFLALPGSLQATCTPPPPGAAHLCRKCGGTYYWVPAEYRKAFLALALATTAQRAQPLPGADSFYVVNVTDILRIEELTIKVKDEKNVTQEKKIPTIVATIDIKVPIDIGRIELSLSSSKSAKPADKTKVPAGSDAQGGGSKTVTFDVAVVDSPDPPKIVQQSNQIKIFFDAKAAAGVLTGPNQLRGLLPITAKLYLHRHRPVAPTGTEALNRIEFQLQQIQFNQLRNGF